MTAASRPAISLLPESRRAGTPGKGPGATGKTGSGMPASRVSAEFLRGLSQPVLAPHDKTAAAAREIVSADARKRIERSAALKAARLARDAGLPSPGVSRDDE